MARLIDTSIEDVKAVTAGLSILGKVKIALAYGWNTHDYDESRISSVTVIDDDKYRSAGGAAAGAIVGGVLTGGIGLLAGAAFGGRRRNAAAFVVTFDDGHHVAFEEKSNNVVTALLRLAQSRKIKTGIAARRGDINDPASPTSDPDRLPVAPGQPGKKPTPWLALTYVALIIGIFVWTYRANMDDEAGMGFFFAIIAVLPFLALALVWLVVRGLWRTLSKPRKV